MFMGFDLVELGKTGTGDAVDRFAGGVGDEMKMKDLGRFDTVHESDNPGNSGEKPGCGMVVAKRLPIRPMASTAIAVCPHNYPCSGNDSAHTISFTALLPLDPQPIPLQSSYLRLEQDLPPINPRSSRFSKAHPHILRRL
jgi:hypothetical protein